MNNPTTRPNLLGRVWLKLATLLIALGLGLISLDPVQAQQSASLCLAITTSVNGVATTSCVPVSATNPLPINLTGTSTGTITAGTTPTSGFTAGQLLMSNGTTVGPAGAALATSLALTGAMSALSYTANSVAGVSCPAASVSLTTFTVTNGIVTHC
jgi:hypothetical protein